MNVKINPGVARGRITAPPSKSESHRLLIAAAMCDGVSHIDGISSCDDVLATIDCLSALGVKIKQDGDRLTVHGIDFRGSTATDTLFCRESASTLRFLIPLTMLSGKPVRFSGKERLMRRPVSVYESLFTELGLTLRQDADGINVCGPLPCKDYTVTGDVSSQFISGLIFALVAMGGESRIRITPPVESRSYIEMTLAALGKFGVSVYFEDENTIFIPEGQRPAATDVRVEGDYSSAAFMEALSLLGGDVAIDGLATDSLQGDRVYARYFEMIAAENATIDISDCPDLGPILFAVAAAKFGGTFTGTRRLSIKESDRVAAMSEELRKLGATFKVYDDAVIVEPCELHAPNDVLSGHNDHRIVMSLAVLLTLTGGEVSGAEATKKSYPSFFEDLASLGIDVIYK